MRSKCDALRNELEYEIKYTKNLADSLKLRKQRNDATDQREAQEQLMITGITDKQNDEDISEVFSIHLCTPTHYSLTYSSITYTNIKYIAIAIIAIYAASYVDI